MQVLVVPVAEPHLSHCKEVVARLKSQGYNVDMDGNTSSSLAK